MTLLTCQKPPDDILNMRSPLPSALSNLATIDDRANNQIDINSMMTAIALVSCTGDRLAVQPSSCRWVQKSNWLSKVSDRVFNPPLIVEHSGRSSNAESTCTDISGVQWVP